MPVTLHRPFRWRPVGAYQACASVKLSEIWKTPTVIDARAGGVVGFIGTITTQFLTLMGSLSYDIRARLCAHQPPPCFPVFIVAHQSVPANTLKELIRLARKPGSSTGFKLVGNGGSTRLAASCSSYGGGAPSFTARPWGSAPRP